MSTPPNPPNPNPDHEEIDVTEIIARIEKLEKENHSQKAITDHHAVKLGEFETRIADCEESIDAIGKHLGE